MKMNKILGLGLIIILCLSCLVGCKKNVEPILIEFETCISESWDRVKVAVENCDLTVLEKERNNLINIQEEIEIENKNYKEEDIEYKTLESLSNILLYRIEALNLVEEILRNPLGAYLNPTLTTQLETCADGLNKDNNMYMKYKEELNIKTDIEIFNKESELNISDL